ncbi:hypothetical protein [Nonomuraea africana]
MDMLKLLRELKMDGNRKIGKPEKEGTGRKTLAEGSCAHPRRRHVRDASPQDSA